MIIPLNCPKCKSFDVIVTDLGFGHDRITCKKCGYYYDEKRLSCNTQKGAKTQ